MSSRESGWVGLAACTVRRPDAGFTELEQRTISESQWSSVTELHHAPERLVPEDVAARMEALLESGPPPRPCEIGL